MGVKLLIHMMMMMVVMLLFIKLAFASNTTNMSVAKPGCQERCGSLVVPYPFGIEPNCSANPSMEIYCDYSFNPPKAFSSGLFYLTSLNNNSKKSLEVLKISVEAGTIHISYPISTTDCTNTSYITTVNLDWPFTFSDTENRFTAMGCNNFALLTSTTFYDLNSSPVGLGGCISGCISALEKKDNSCSGTNCCQTQFPASLTIVEPAFIVNLNSTSLCRVRNQWHAFIVEQSWFKKLKDIYSVQTMETVPAVLNWRTYGPDCQSFLGNETFFNRSSTLCGINASCTNQNLCSCRKGYEGNPYLPDGCQATCAGLGVLLAAMLWLYKVIRQRNIRKLEEKFFKRNGGLLLRQQLSCSEGNMETNKLFTSKELEKATDRYNVDRIVGQGGQGTVYKGMLTDGRIVAVKKSKIEDESKLQHFINEVVILSQINHRNIVKLHGCCLQTEIPLLVYEFIPNGTLMQYIHEHNEYFPLTWDVRLRVATEISGALYYLHAAASIPIYHRDIKSTNILLDDKYRAKVADFGTSKSFSIDQTHQTTSVQGTFGYLDPEYFQSSQFTDKSDVYSFGVVLVELLTGQKPILAARLEEKTRSLATLFTLAMEENRILDIIDSRIIKEGKNEEMIAFADIAYRCLNLNGRKRPTMRQVVAELESIRYTHESPAQQNYEEVEYGKDELNAPWQSDVTSSTMSSTVHHSLSIDNEPLLTN